MGDAGGQVADRGKLLRLHQLAFQFLALADLFLQRLLGLADFQVISWMAASIRLICNWR